MIFGFSATLVSANSQSLKIFFVASNKLTIKQEKFCNKYLECGNASEAYRYAYNCLKMNDETIWKRSSELLQNGEVAGRLEYLKNHLAEAAGISALRIIREHQKIAFSDATRIRNGWMSLKEFESLTDDEKACIKSIETKQTKRKTLDGDVVIDEQVKITCYDKQKALDSIVNMLGLNAPTKIEAAERDNTTELRPRSEYLSYSPDITGLPPLPNEAERDEGE